MIQRIGIRETKAPFTEWIEIYPVEGIIHPVNNLGQLDKSLTSRMT